MNDHIKKITESLFRFLKRFHELRTKPKYNVELYEKVLWLHEIPKEKECFSIIRKIASEKFNKDSENFEKWVEVKKPKKNPQPKPPKEIISWLKDKNLDNPEKIPQLFTYIIKDVPIESEETIDEEKENDKIFLEDCPEIKRAFENWLNQKWDPWASEKKRLKAVSKVYNSLYEIYKKNEALGEVYQIILGLGLLSSKNKKGPDIKRHIVTTPISIDFNSISGAITLGPCEQGAELSLEMNMLQETEKPKPEDCDKINSQLSDLSNNFWVEEDFYDNLKSWLNSYDPNGQFFKNFEKPETESFTTLNISPAIILRKRNEKEFIKFYDSVVKDMEEKEKIDRPCLQNLINGGMPPSSREKSGKGSGILHGKHYFPLPVNEEQEKIIEKTENNNQVVVQGPPGTGKTHSIVNLICHFLAKEQRILVTSQTDRALKVLKNKLPEEIKPLCVEILGRDQKSFQALKKSFEIINSKHQRLNEENLLKEIKKLEEKDDKLKGKLATVKARLIEIKKGESKKFEKLFGFYTGTPAVIASKVKEEEERYRWIKETFNRESDFASEAGAGRRWRRWIKETFNRSFDIEECPVSNDEAVSFLKLIKKTKNIDDSLLEESVDFTNQVFTFQQLQKKIREEKDTKKFLEKHKSFVKSDRSEQYENMKDEDLTQLKQQMDSLQVEALLNRNEKWVKQALNDCLADKDREWRYLYETTNKILDENQDIFKEAGKIREIKIDHSIPKTDLDLQNLLEDFFRQHKSNDKIGWGWFCSKAVRKLKKIKIDGNPISSYEGAKKFQKYITAKRAFEKINNLWMNQGIDTKETQNRYFERDYHIFKGFCELLNNCLSFHKTVEDVNRILLYNNISQPLWTSDSVKIEKRAMAIAVAKKTLTTLLADFEGFVSILKPYKNQKNGIAEKFIFAVKNRNPEEYQETLEEANNFRNRKKEFDEICQIKEKLNDLLYLKLKKEIDNPLWEDRLRCFEEAWAWQRADLWLQEQEDEMSFKSLSEEKERLSKDQKQNMELLASEKAWISCLSQITDEDLSNLRALIQSIAKIGKGTGKSASRHRKTAKKRMEECKTAVPAWIMPLYRVVENINPSAKPFDIVIIDEASQTGPDGFLINYLAKKIIVVGDKEQISPENPGISEEKVKDLNDKWLSGIKFSECIGRDYSYYDYCEILFTKSYIQLREHFRCMPEIIQFSNQISYTGIPLIPLRQYGSSRLPPLKKTFVPNAVSKIGSNKQPQNKEEARQIVEQIRKCIQDPKYKGKTFGIISLQGKSQARIIEQALAEIDDKVEMEKRAIQVGDAYDFQGDERNVIFLSMAVAKDWHISALTRETYKRRYNVAASRAKDQMWLFHSVEMNDLPNKEDYRRQLLEHFSKDAKNLTVRPLEELNELYKKIKETKDKSPENAPPPFHSWFEARVFHKIAMRGYQVIPQYKVSEFSVDMIIVGSKGRLAVECDGDYWHEGREEEDLERQWKLERCGWTFWRLRESVFNRDEEEALKSLWDKLKEMQIFPLGKDKMNQNLADQ